MTLDDHVAVEESAAAELRGDWTTAYERHRAVPMFVSSQHGNHLRLMADLGDAAPDWLRSRFVVSLVRRWEGYGQPRRAGRVLQTLVPIVYPHGVPVESLDVDHVQQVGPQVFMRDWIVRQADVFDLGGLDDLLRLPRAVGAIGTAPRVADWARATMGGWRIVAADGAVLVVADADSGAEVALLDLGLTHHLEVGAHVLGRMVPTTVGPGLLFDARPMPVDERTAAAVARNPQRWLTILGDRARLRPRHETPSHLTDSSLTADLPRHAWGALLGHPIDGFDRIPRTLAAEALKAALGLALDADVLQRRRALVTELLLDEVVDEHLVTRFATPSYAAAWRTLREVLPDHATRWCDEALWMVDATPEGMAG